MDLNNQKIKRYHPWKRSIVNQKHIFENSIKSRGSKWPKNTWIENNVDRKYLLYKSDNTEKDKILDIWKYKTRYSLGIADLNKSVRERTIGM